LLGERPAHRQRGRTVRRHAPERHRARAGRGGPRGLPRAQARPHRLHPGAQELLVPLREPELVTTMNTLPLYIGGRFVNGADPTQRVVNRATGETIAVAARATTAETDAAIRAARAAFDQGPWATATAQRRGRVLLEIARRLRESAAELARLETENMGKPIIE